MKSLDRRSTKPARLSGGHGPTILAAVALLAAGAVAAAGCGGSGDTPASAAQGGGATSMQVLAKVERGDIVQAVAGGASLKTSNGKTVAVVQVTQQNAASVAVGQTATVMVMQRPTGSQSGAPMPQPGESGAAMPQPSNLPGGQNDQNGQGGVDGGAFGGNALRGRGTAGKVTAVTTNADGSATVTIALSKKLANATATSVGLAVIQTKVLASDVMIVPTAAIKGSGDSATVEVLADGKTSTVSVVVGQQSGGQSEIVSGLSVGQNVVYTRSFQRGGLPGNGPAPRQSGAPIGGQSGDQSSGGSL